jgi:hypothetical protein
VPSSNVTVCLADPGGPLSNVQMTVSPGAMSTCFGMYDVPRSITVVVAARADPNENAARAPTAKSTSRRRPPNLSMPAELSPTRGRAEGQAEG